nr:unnamed protein product [Digitaria exilis]
MLSNQGKGSSGTFVIARLHVLALHQSLTAHGAVGQGATHTRQHRPHRRQRLRQRRNSQQDLLILLLIDGIFFSVAQEHQAIEASGPREAEASGKVEREQLQRLGGDAKGQREDACLRHLLRNPKCVAGLPALLESILLPKTTVDDLNLRLGHVVGDILRHY